MSRLHEKLWKWLFATAGAERIDVETVATRFEALASEAVVRERAGRLFRDLLEALPDAMVIVGREGRIVLVNAKTEKLFCYQRDELIDQTLDMLIGERFRGPPPASLGSGSLLVAEGARSASSDVELRGRRKDGTEFPIEIMSSPLQTEEGGLVSNSIRDITERVRASDLLRKQATVLAGSLKEREVLLQEVHHRVKNNLQVIASLINMQIRQVTDGPSRSVLVECQTRVHAIALIHEKLYQSKDYAHVPFSEYARSLAGNIFHATGVSPARVSLNLNIGAFALAAMSL
jgi:PAS domain S-box-containing protein